MVLWAIPVSDLGGVARHVLDVVACGVPGWRIAVLVPPGPLAERCVEAGAAVIVEPFGPGHGTARSVASLRRVVARLRPALVHSHLSYADIASALASLTWSGGSGSAPRLVSTEHGIADDDLVYHGSPARSRVMATAHRLRLRRMHGLVLVSDATRRVVEEKWRPPGDLVTRVIRNGLDRERVRDALPARAPGLRIGTLSRLAPEKGLLELLDAFALVVRQHPEATLAIAGDGPLADDLRARRDELGLQDRVSLLGHVDAPKLLGEIDVLAQLSVWENCSYSILDALGAGVGVVATGVGGNPELLPDRCLVARGDASAAAERIVEQGLHPGRRATPAPDWPTVSEMCGKLSGMYDEVGR